MREAALRHRRHVAVGHNLCLHFGEDELPCTTYVDVHQGYTVLTHSHVVLTLTCEGTSVPSAHTSP